MTIDVLLIIAAPTLIGLWVLGKILFGKIEHLEERENSRTTPVFGYEQRTYSMEIARQIEELRVRDASMSPRIIVCEGPISQSQLEALRNSLSVINEPESICTVDNRRLELS